MNQKWALLALPLALASATAFADTCTTESRGYFFRETGTSRISAFDAATNRCKSVSSTSNSECNLNARCEVDAYTDYSSPVFDCTSESRGYYFRRMTSDYFNGMGTLANECKANSSTSNSECDRSLQCNLVLGRPFGPSVAYNCTTESRGYFFRDVGTDQWSTQSRNINRCAANSSTSNSDCERFSVCSTVFLGGGYNPPSPPPYYPPSPPPYYPPSPPPYYPPSPPPYYPPSPPPYYPPSPPPYYPPSPPRPTPNPPPIPRPTPNPRPIPRPIPPHR